MPMSQPRLSASVPSKSKMTSLNLRETLGWRVERRSQEGNLDLECAPATEIGAGEDPWESKCRVLQETSTAYRNVT